MQNQLTTLYGGGLIHQNLHIFLKLVVQSRQHFVVKYVSLSRKDRIVFSLFGLQQKRKHADFTYPRQFWLLFWGMLINRGSVSMMWPFLTVYLNRELGISLVTVGLLLSVRALFSVISTGFTSTLMDRLGRKWVMIISLYASALVFVGMSFASDLTSWAILLAAHGFVLPIFNNGVNAMVADIVPNEHRAPAYALIRTVANTGIAIGPIIGGTVALISFQAIFIVVAVVYVLLGTLAIIVLNETRPTDIKPKRERFGGYNIILRDRTFLAFCFGYILTLAGTTQMFSLLPVYSSVNFGLVETEYSIFLSVNAVMVVFLQYLVTRITDRYPPRLIIALGGFIYAIGLYSIIPGSALLHFTLSMIVFTLGELILTPTALKLVADMAPEDMRARYLGVLSLGYPLGSGIGPVIGGWLNDAIAPVAIWYGAGTLALAGAICFVLIAYRVREQQIREIPSHI